MIATWSDSDDQAFVSSDNEEEIVAFVAYVDGACSSENDVLADDTNVSSSHELSSLYESLFDEMRVSALDNVELTKMISVIIWDNLPVTGAIRSYDLIEKYKLHRYDMKAYHREAYVDSFTSLVKGQVSKSHLKLFYKIWSNFLCRNVLGSSNNGLNNVMSVVAQGQPRPVLPPNVSQEKKIAYLESKINSLRKQFVDFSQSASLPLPSLQPPKLVPHRPVDLSFISYHIVASSSHSSAVVAKMATKGKRVSINVHIFLMKMKMKKALVMVYTLEMFLLKMSLLLDLMSTQMTHHNQRSYRFMGEHLYGFNMQVLWGSFLSVES
ncbi:hypothetical protein D8674_008501 [Pyrus ussuriensis x Pyrus communis]|uniref:Uncharacterized protein n=1 Tax=Pyrus ussuriensis x Pyrus communis TaxID=2448454 RepID=A0A5N5HXS0_9ROSA|nr:hypothetical protein D8674_008501 [Pyrus ussuriensis x Pyrus communis]